MFRENSDIYYQKSCPHETETRSYKSPRIIDPTLRRSTLAILGIKGTDVIVHVYQSYW